MDWYYAQQGQRRGPVSEVEMTGLVTAGLVTDQTLVWREGMADWQTYGEAKAGVPVAAPPPVWAPPPEAALPGAAQAKAASPALLCPRCQAPLASVQVGLRSEAPCPRCQAPTQLEVFPAWLRPRPAGNQAEAIVLEGEASCFYHPKKRAATHCGTCGRFLCALCDIDLNGRHLCPSCLESSQRKGKLAELENRRTLYDSAALTVAIVGPFVTCFIGAVLTGPIAITLALYGWKRPGSIIPRTHIRAVLAILLGLLEMSFWVLVIYFAPS
jgi:hypothetical protein